MTGQPSPDKAPGIYEARMVYLGTELWKGEPFGSGEPAAKLVPYPNPTRNGQFALFTPAAGNLILKDITGSTVWEQPLKAGLNQLAVPATLSSGIYAGQFKPQNAPEIQSFRLGFRP